jgi:DNA-binding Lrp family transcriptional regulator
VTPHSAGWSTLAAMVVPASRLAEVAGLVSNFPEVNHNYEREHHFNLWFVVTGEDRAHVASVLEEIEVLTGLTVIDLPLLESFRLDLGFPLQWS